MCHVNVPEPFIILHLFQLFNTEDYAAPRRPEKFPAPVTAAPLSGGPPAIGPQRAPAASGSVTTVTHSATAERAPCAAVTAPTRPDAENAVQTPEVGNRAV